MSESNNNSWTPAKILAAAVLLFLGFLFLQTTPGFILFIGGYFYGLYQVAEYLNDGGKKRAALALWLLSFPLLMAFVGAFYWLSGCILGVNDCTIG